MTTTAFVYKWTHIPTGSWYIGSRTKKGCNPDDGYICSSKTIKPLITENRGEWTREIIAIGEPAAMLELETRYLVSLDAKNDPMSYNQHNSDGKFSTSGQAPWNKGRGKPIGKPSWNAGLTKADHPGLAKMAKSKLGSTPYNKGQSMSEEQRLKMIEIHNNRSEETCKKISEALTGRTQTEEANAKRSATLKGRVSPRKGKTYPKQKGPKPLL